MVHELASSQRQRELLSLDRNTRQQCQATARDERSTASPIRISSVRPTILRLTAIAIGRSRRIIIGSPRPIIRNDTIDLRCRSSGVRCERELTIRRWIAAVSGFAVIVEAPIRRIGLVGIRGHLHAWRCSAGPALKMVRPPGQGAAFDFSEIESQRALVEMARARARPMQS